MNLKEFAKKESIKDFFVCLRSQAKREYSDETFELAIDVFFKLFNIAEKMNEDDADAYLTACLGLYMLEAFETGTGDLLIGIKPGK